MGQKPLNTKIQAFIDALASHRWPDTFNPWRQVDELDALRDAAHQRRERLVAHLACPNPQQILLGEAPGYQGAHFSGLAFTSERLLLDGAIPRVPALLGERISTRKLPWSEPSATIMWGAFYELGIAENTVLWNSFAYHPFKPGKPLSNRTPTPKERQRGLELLKQFLALYPGVPVVAVGKQAEASLQDLGIDTACCCRHPAMGGATEFRQQLADFIHRR